MLQIVSAHPPDLTGDAEAGNHLRTEDVAAYLNGALSAEERHVVEDHLSICRSCRVEVTRARRLLRTSPESRRRWVTAAPALAAAAVVAFILLLPKETTRIEQQDERSLRGRTETIQVIDVIRPADGATLRSGDVMLAWHAQPNEPLYRVSLTDGGGQQVWSADTRDTTLTVPRDVRLTAGTQYLWYIDALDARGRSVTSGMLRFSIAR
jgi:hypothetical protein